MSMLFYVTFLLLVHLSGSNASCELSSFYSSIPELSNGKPTTRDGWESVLNKLNNLLEDTHVTVPYTSTSTDVVCKCALSTALTMLHCMYANVFFQY
mmetsp:Transcript_4286/g.7289  ORF Transcript_4286/g.7289 Transcript_4286/m.7289 type:complete len:97 (-) Transcript_4286:1679-1969(-)